MKELHQKRGKNWRKFTVLNDAIEVKSSLRGDYTSLKLLFDEIGLLRPDYEKFSIAEHLYPPRTRWIIVIVGIALSFIFGNIADALKDNIMLYSTLTALSILSVFGAIGTGFYKRKAKYKRIYFEAPNGQYLNFYYETPQETEQVDKFVKSIDSAIKEYFKAGFLAQVKTNPEFLGAHLESLHKRGVFSEAEYRKYAKVVKPEKAKVKN